MDVTELSRAIDAFNAASAGDFHAPDEGEWDAAMIIAHIAETARTFSDTTRDVLEGASAAYDNAPTTFEPFLRRVVKEAGSICKLRVLAAARSQELLDLMARLTDEQAATLVPVRVIDGERVILNVTRPWAGALNRARIHLHAHTETLEVLRS